MEAHNRNRINQHLLIITEINTITNKYRMMEDQKYYQRQREAILNDSHRKELFKALFDLYANAMPIVLKKDDGTIESSYSDEVEELAEKIRGQIRLKDNQVFESHSH